MRAVITYHSIDPSGSAISISETDFRRHVLGWQPGVLWVSNELLTSGQCRRHRAAFDDAFPALEKSLAIALRSRFSSTLFVVSGKVG